MKIISEQNKYADILGLDFTCKKEPPLEMKWPGGCPNSNDGPGPELMTDTGEQVCRKCGRIVGQQSGLDDDMVDDDPLDEEDADYKGESAYVSEGTMKKDFTAEEQRSVDRRDKIIEINFVIQGLDKDFSIYLAENESYIVTTLMELENANEPEFITKMLVPKIIAVASYLFHRQPNAEAFKALKEKFPRQGIKPADIDRRVRSLQSIKEPYIDNEIQRNIISIAKSLDIPETIYQPAIENFEKERPTNSVPNDKVRAAAWLYLQTIKTGYKVNKGDFYKIPGISRSNFNKAHDSYIINMRNIKDTDITEEDSED